MKKFLPIILLPLFLAIGLVPLVTRAASGLSITTDPSTAKVGDKVTITMEVEEAPANSANVVLYISDTVVSKPTGEEAHLKGSWQAPDPGASASYRYIWDTAAARSNPGLHYINVFVVDKDNYVLLNQTTTYTLAPGPSPSPNPSVSASGGSGAGGTGGGGSKASSAIGDFGTIIFPSTKVSSFRDLIVAVIDWLLVLAGSLAVVAIIYSGIMYIMAGSDATKAEMAKKNLIWAIIGVVVIGLSLVIINTVVDVLGGQTGSSTSPTTPSPVPSASTFIGPPLPPSPSSSPLPSPSHS